MPITVKDPRTDVVARHLCCIASPIFPVSFACVTRPAIPRCRGVADAAHRDLPALMPFVHFP